MYKNINKLFTVLSFLIPLIIYCLTMAPTTSFWDCGEYIATSRILGVPHPPGSPLFLLLGNFFSNLPLFSDIGARVNLISPIASALSVMFLYLIISHFIKEFNGKVNSVSSVLITYCSAFVASMTFAVTDAHWFNAVEAEIYALSTFFTSIVVWMILKWNSKDLDNWNLRYLLIIAYMLGLATGLHLLNLLTLPFIALIVYFKKFNISIKTFLFTVFFTLLTFCIIYIGIIKGVPDITSKTNNLIYIILLPLLLIIATIINKINIISKNLSYLINLISISFITILLLNPIFIHGPESISLTKYNELVDIQIAINKADKEIYLMSESFKENSDYQDYSMQEKINAKINQRNIEVKNYEDKYNDYLLFEKNKKILSFFGLIKWQSKINLISILLLLSITIFITNRFYVINPLRTYYFLNFFYTFLILIFIGYSTYIMIFVRSKQQPAINENSPDTISRALSYMNREQYGDWEILNVGSTLSRAENTNWKRYTFDKNNPTFAEKMKFFFSYQINEMYLRYFAWQFIGRGEKEEYPWYIKDLNGNLIGNQKLDGINWTKYGIPLALIIGIIGIIFHFSQDWRNALALLSLFLATGLMIIIYLNQYDPQPRERDYSYVGSFFSFSIWIGIGLSYIQIQLVKFFEDKNISSYISGTFICFILILMPIKMFATDYREHNRTGNYVAWDYGYNLLNSCEPNGIIFTNGDNDTFPLWYLQEVEGIRKDVKVVNLSLLNTAWYINQLKDLHPKLNLNFVEKEIKDDLYNLDPWIGTELSFKLCNQEFIDQHWDNLECNLSVDNHTLNFNIKPTLIKKLLRVQDYLILKIIQDIGKSKPIYFAATVSINNQIGLHKYLQMEGMTYRLLFDKKTEPINFKKMKQNLTQGEEDKIIKNSKDYIARIKSGKGVYRYTNLNDTAIYFNDNIKRLVQNYRIGFIRLAEYQLSNNKVNNEIEVINLIDNMNNYFPEKTLPIEPGIKILISDSIYGPLGNYKMQKNILTDLFNNNIPIETKIYLFHKIAELKDDNLTIDLSIKLINSHLDELDFELEKYIGDILSDYLSPNDFISLCHTIFKKNKLVGMLYSLVRVLNENNLNIDAINIVNQWLKDDPLNDDLILLEEYLNNIQ